MKRILSITLAALVILAVLSLTACGDKKLPVGSYQVVDLSGKVDASWKNAILEVTDDSSGVFAFMKSSNGYAATAIEIKNGKIIGEGIAFKYTYKDGKLTLKGEGGTIILHRYMNTNG